MSTLLLTKKGHTALRLAAALLAVVVVLTMMHVAALFRPAQAVALLNVVDLITTSAPSANANHQIDFDLAGTSAGLAADDSAAIVVTFDDETPDDFDLTGLVIGDIDIETDTGMGLTDRSIAADCTGAEHFGVSIAIGSPDRITFTMCTDGVALSASDSVRIEIGTNAAGGTNQINNPGTENSYPITIVTDDDGTLGAGEIDHGEARIMVIPQVTMSAMVDTNLDCQAAGATEGVTVINTVTVDTDGPDCGFANAGTMSDVLLDFDFVCPDDGDALDRELAGQVLTVTTNATNGFLWTVEQDTNMAAGSADIDLFLNGAATATPTDWASPTGTIAGGEAGYGHYGITSEDADLETDTGGGDADDFDDTASASCGAAPCVAGNIASARNIFAATGPADGTTADIGTTDWGVFIEISSLQEAGSYQNALTHICTPTF